MAQGIKGTTPLCSVEGCDRPSHTRGLCGMHAHRWQRHGTTGTTRPGITERFWAKVRLTPGCWFWVGAHHEDGYGQIRYQGRNWTANRVAWLLAYGPPPDELMVLHHCDEPSCVRIDHLYLGTNADNMRDRADRGRHASTLRTHCPQGHPYDEANTRIYNGRRTCIICNRENVRRYRSRQRARAAP